jgi:phage-related minor tail protein
MSTLADLLVKIGVDNSGVDKGTQQTESKFEKTWNRVKATAAVAGAAIGLAVAASAVSALDIDAAGDKLAGQLGATAEEAGRFGKAAGDLYAGAWGESIGQVNDAVGAVVTSIEGMRSASEAALEAMTARALDFATAFNVDVADATQIASSLISNKLARDGTHAFDLLTAASQKVPTALVGDLLEVGNEYGQFFRMIGFSGEEAFALLANSAGKGSWGIDKAADSVKEFGILATELDGPPAEAFKALGLNAHQMSNAILAGGDQAKTAFDKTVAGLLKVKDPARQAQLALDLFGAPLEDMSKGEIPEFLKALGASRSSLGEVAGASDKLGKTLNDNAKTTLTGFKRSAEQALVEQLAKAVPHLQSVAGWLGEHKSLVVPLVKALTGFLAVVAAITLATKTWAGVMIIVNAATKTWLVLSKAAKVATVAWTAVQWLLNLAMSANPLGLIILAVIALIAIIVLIATKTTWFQTIWEAVWGAIKAAAEFVFNWIVGGWTFVFNTVVGILKLWWTVFSGFWGKVGQIAADTWNWIIGKITGFVGFVKGLPGKIANAAKGMWNGIVSAFKSAINTLIRLWNNFDLTLGGGSVLGLDIPSITLRTPNIPYLADGGIVPATPGGTLALIGEGRYDEAVVPLPRGASQLDGGSGGGTLTLNFTGATGNPMAVWLAKSVRNGDVQLIDSAGRRVRVAGG